MILWLNHPINPALIAAVVPMYHRGGLLVAAQLYLAGREDALQISCTESDYTKLKELLDLGHYPTP